MMPRTPRLEQKEWYASIPRSGRKATLAGFVIMASTFGGFGVWASTAPIAGAVIAQGSFVAVGNNKVIQHLEGGVIAEILVAEGDIVEAGATLVRLDETHARANLRRLSLRQVRLQAMRTRLLQEAQGATDLRFSTAVEDIRTDPAVDAILDAQTLAFDVRNRQLVSDIEILERSKSALEERIIGAQEQLAAIADQTVFYEEEHAAKEGLFERGYVEKPAVLSIKRALANMRGEKGRLLADIGDSRERIERADAQIAKARTAMAETAVNELHQVSADLDDVGEQILAARNVLDRIEITSPVRGIVVDLGFHSPGGVIESGTKVMEIVPLDGGIHIEVEIQPRDIDNVFQGQGALVRLTALNQRTTPMMPAEVVYLSADALPRQDRGPVAERYTARLALDDEALKRLAQFEARPGMPAEVYIQSRERTFMDYLMEPITDSMSRSFREL
jgi:HlyD family type I secretion membrane fusion protein